MTLSSFLEGGDSLAALSRSLDAQSTAAGSRAAAQATLAAERHQLIDRRAGLGRELAEARRNIELQEERLALARAEVARAETIAAQDFLPRRELEARRSMEQAVQQEASTLASRSRGSVAMIALGSELTSGNPDAQPSLIGKTSDGCRTPSQKGIGGRPVPTKRLAHARAKA